MILFLILMIILKYYEDIWDGLVGIGIFFLFGWFELSFWELNDR